MEPDLKKKDNTKKSLGEWVSGMLSGLFNWNAFDAHKLFARDVERIFAIQEEEYGSLGDISLEEFGKLARKQTQTWQELIQSGEKQVDDIKHEAFALVLEVAKRKQGMEPRECQVECALALHSGVITEMKTGEGKTLVATMPVYLNALTGKGAHVMTVNDYLASRDANWMGEIYEFLGLSVGCITQGLDNNQRRKQYAKDITYGTNDEFGFDYLRDNMKHSAEDMVQRGYAFAIIDEADSIMIDEARTPLVISGPAEDASKLYEIIDVVILQLNEEDYTINEKERHVIFTEEGNEHVEDILEKQDLLNGISLFALNNTTILHHVNQALKAHMLFERDRDYIVKDDKLIIVNQSTGRTMPGQRYNDNLHQALEAKEHVTIQPESKTLASVTRQNYLRLYDKLSGMTGTALTEAEEFASIYDLDTLEIAPHKPLIREDEEDEVYLTEQEKYEVIIKEILESRDKGQPVLVGTASVKKSELLSSLLKAQGIPHQMLNAVHHEQEAQIIAEAGIPGTITIATNMAGRGVDIKLGGNPEMRIALVEDSLPKGPKRDRKIAAIRADVAAKRKAAMEAGGLYVIGTERHESRRIDNQLRGRSGRQGEPGRSKFYLSLDDDLIRVFAGDKMKDKMISLGVETGEVIQNSWLTKAIEIAQKRIENRNFDIRKNLLKYDDVINTQRKIIFSERKDVMDADDVEPVIRSMFNDVADSLLAIHTDENAFPEQWNIKQLKEDARNVFNIEAPLEDWIEEDEVTVQTIREHLMDMIDEAYKDRTNRIGPEIMRQVEKNVLLQVYDVMWQDHSIELDTIRKTIHLRAYAQRNPLYEFQSESYNTFVRMLKQIDESVTATLTHVELAPVVPQPSQEKPPQEDPSQEKLSQSFFQNSLTLPPAVKTKPSSYKDFVLG